jgi:hypothetical protein
MLISIWSNSIFIDRCKHPQYSYFMIKALATENFSNILNIQLLIKIDAFESTMHESHRTHTTK